MLVMALVLLAACGGVIFLMSKSISKWKGESARWENNYAVVTDSLSETIKSQELTIDELSQERPDIIKKAKDAGIRRKEIRYITITKYTDTGRVLVEYRDTFMEGDSVQMGSVDTGCHHATIKMVGDKVAEYTWATDFDLTTIGYWKRTREAKIFKWTLFRFGKKEVYHTVINNCNGQKLIENERLEIKK